MRPYDVNVQVGLYRFRVEGETQGVRSYVLPFDETYEVTGEHPAEALRKLLSEIEWGILDTGEPFTISLVTEDNA